MLKVHAKEEWQHERTMLAKQRGICNRLLHSSVRLMGMGFNKLLEEFKEQRRILRQKLRFIISSFTNNEAKLILMAYNGLKQSALALDNNVYSKKRQFLRHFVEKGYSLQMMAINSMKTFLVKQRHIDKLKDSILRRIMFSEVRKIGQALRLLKIHAKEAKKSEQNLIAKKLAIIRRLTDINTRVLLQGWNTFMANHKALKQRLVSRLKFIITC